MGFREWNRRKNNWLRMQKGKLAARLLGTAPDGTPYNPSRVSKILLLRNDNKLGDSVACSSFLRALGRLFPSARTDVVAWKDNAALFLHHPGISRIYYADESFWRLFRLGRKLRGERYDLYIDLDEKPTFSSQVFLKWLSPRWAFGFNRENYPLYNVCGTQDLSSCHITERYEAAVRRLEFAGKFDSSYEVFIPEDSLHRAEAFRANLPKTGRLLVLCPLAASRHRSLCAEQAEGVARAFAGDKIVLCGRAEELRAFWRGKSASNVFLYDTAQNVLDSAALVKLASGVLTVDTFWAHLICATGTPAVAVYRHCRDNLTVWSPHAENATVIFCEEEQRDVPAGRLAEALRARLKD